MEKSGPRHWLLLILFALFVIFLYGPTLTIFILSFQGPDGGLTFPMRGVSIYWFQNLFEPQMVGDFGGSLERSLSLALIAPSLVGVALFGFSLSYDEFSRTIMAAGSDNTLPLEVFAMTTNVTTPVLYALGSMTTLFSFAVVITVTLTVLAMRRKRGAKLAG